MDEPEEEPGVHELDARGFLYRLLVADGVTATTADASKSRFSGPLFFSRRYTICTGRREIRITNCREKCVKDVEEKTIVRWDSELYWEGCVKWEDFVQWEGFSSNVELQISMNLYASMPIG